MAGHREKSASYDQDSEDESHLEGPGAETESNAAPGKPGRKKNPNSQAARRDQNRIAQREFRLRKQQRIRDLEARVELLSGTKDETVGELRNVIRDLMQENSSLRALVKSLSAFIGDNTAAVVTTLGWDVPEFTNFMNRSETDTAVEGFQRRKRLQHGSTTSPSSMTHANKRPAEDDRSLGEPGKKARSGEHDRNSFSSLVPLNAPVTMSELYSTPARSTQDDPLFSDLFRGASAPSPMFTTSPPESMPPYGGPSPSSVTSQPYTSNYSQPVNASHSDSSSLPATLPFNLPSSSGAVPAQQSSTRLGTPPADGDDLNLDPKRQEAGKLIHYHLQNFSRNSAYCLPASLRPTVVQRTVPHEGIIDGILHPELRDRMILLRGRFVLVDCLHDYRKSVTIHGDDVLSHSNWEVGERWLRQYPFLVDQAVLSTTNRWRRERGEHEILLADLMPGEQHTQQP